ncbi:DUF2489 domain-containing protein [Thalassomonas actiniarum]|uniref:DUF2489 domain-containing protein n=1 Tax=Thalassomonas actiniarum TaxID=485447 RepID=A0AAE9YS37_9GAMM|nr:DUF2489 domain-containing protein [Thalassomonas actiniarum]WDD99418.1 DUF2489 domain-containing protein [Thalassomonas actiniarum]
MSTPWLIAIIVAVIIIAALAFYAGKLLRQLKQQTLLQQKAEQKHQAALDKHDAKVLNSVIIIVRAMKEEQCDYSEGCWRLSVLLDSLKKSSALDQQFPAIFELYNRIKHLTILDERKQLAKQQRMKQDLERMKVEAELRDKVSQDLELLHQYANERYRLLSK